MTVDDAYRGLDRIGPRIRKLEGELKSLYDERRVLFRFLLGAKEKKAEVARRAGVSAMAVTLAVRDPSEL